MIFLQILLLSFASTFMLEMAAMLSDLHHECEDIANEQENQGQ